MSGSMKKSFVVYTDWAEFLEDITDEEAGILFKALFEYAADGTEPAFKGAMRPIFRMMKNCLDRDGAKWEDRCRKNAENGRKGGIAKAEKRAALANAADRLANVADSDSESDTDNDTESESESESESERDKEKEKAGCAGSASPSPALPLGEFRNVFLSEEEIRSLKDDLGETAVDKAVEEMSEYCASTGKKYKNWAAAVRRWIKRDSTPKSFSPRPNYHSRETESYDLDEWMKTALSLPETWK